MPHVFAVTLKFDLEANDREDAMSRAIDAVDEALKAGVLDDVLEIEDTGKEVPYAVEGRKVEESGE